MMFHRTVREHGASIITSWRMDWFGLLFVSPIVAAIVWALVKGSA